MAMPPAPAPRMATRWLFDLLLTSSSVLREVGPVGARLLDEDEDDAPRVAEPGGAHPRDVGNARDDELHALRLEIRAHLRDVLADQGDVAQAGIDERPVIA